MWANLVLAFASAGFALVLATRASPARELAWIAGTLAAWQCYSACAHGRRPTRTVLRLGGFSWTLEDFVRGWLINGETGRDKTLDGINAMLWEVSKHCPHWDGVFE